MFPVDIPGEEAFKDPVWSLLCLGSLPWYGFDPQPKNLGNAWARPQKKKYSQWVLISERQGYRHFYFPHSFLHVAYISVLEIKKIKK